MLACVKYLWPGWKFAYAYSAPKVIGLVALGVLIGGGATFARGQASGEPATPALTPIDRVLLAASPSVKGVISIKQGPMFLTRLRDSRLGPVAMRSGLLEEPLKAWRRFANAVDSEPQELVESLTSSGFGLLASEDEEGVLRVGAIMAIPPDELAKLRRQLSLTPADVIEGCAHLNLEQGRLRVLIAPKLEDLPRAQNDAQTQVQLIAVTAGDVPREFLELVGRALRAAVEPEGAQVGAKMADGPSKLSQVPLAARLRREGDMWLLARPSTPPPGDAERAGEAQAQASTVTTVQAWREGFLIEGELEAAQWSFGVRTLEPAPEVIRPSLLSMYESLMPHASSLQITAEAGTGKLDATAKPADTQAPRLLRIGGAFAATATMLSSLAPASSVFSQPMAKRAGSGVTVPAEGTLFFSFSHGTRQGSSIGFVSPSIAIAQGDELATSMLRLIDQPMEASPLGGLLPSTRRSIAYAPRPGHRAYPIVGPEAELTWWQLQGQPEALMVMLLSPAQHSAEPIGVGGRLPDSQTEGGDESRLRIVQGHLQDAMTSLSQQRKEVGAKQFDPRGYFFRSLIRLGPLTDSLAPPISLSLQPLAVMQTVALDLWQTADRTIEGELRIEWAP